MNIRTVADLMRAHPRRLREHFSVVVGKAVRELNGIQCMNIEIDTPSNKETIASRSFGTPIFDREELAKSIREYMMRAVTKLRRQRSLASVVGCWIETNAFHEQDAQYSPSAAIQLVEPSDDLRVLTKAALKVLSRIWKPGHRYNKSGVMLLGLSDPDVVQGQLVLLAPQVDTRWDRLLDAIDGVNGRLGRGSIALESAGVKCGKRWSMQRGNLSPAYTSKWDEIPVVR